MLDTRAKLLKQAAIEERLGMIAYARELRRRAEEMGK